MDSPPADQDEHHQDDHGPVPLGSDLIEVLARLEGREQVRVEKQKPVPTGAAKMSEAAHPVRSIQVTE
jgi:hypothetical protein